ncbi:hypothetical protein [Pseudomonas aeruginosa]
MAKIDDFHCKGLQEVVRRVQEGLEEGLLPALQAAPGAGQVNPSAA